MTEASQLVVMPAGLDFDRAAGLTVTYGTTMHALNDRAKIKPGETLAVLGAAGGTGLAAVELGKLMGARVIACASSDDKLAFARRHGADDGVNYGGDRSQGGLRALTGGKRRRRGLRSDRRDAGRSGAARHGLVRALSDIGFASGDMPKLPANIVLLHSYDVLGVYWGAWTQRNPQGHNTNMRQILDWCAQGKLSSHVHAIYPLNEAPAALKASPRAR